MVQQTRDARSDIGGRAIPTNAVFQVMPELRAAQQQFHHKDSRWLDCLETRQCRDLIGANSLAVGKRPVRIVDLCSDAPQDLYLRQKLLKQLAVMRRKTEMVAWYDRDIAPGRTVDAEMRQRVEEADIIFLFISPDFFASDMLDELMQLAMRRSAPRRVSVIPILLRPVEDWESQPFGGLTRLPQNNRFINTFSNKDVVLAEVARAIRTHVEQVWSEII